jgi:hypothetical protein
VRKIKKYRLTIAGIFLGALGGYVYYHYIGCVTGACPITSQPINSTLYGALMGGLLRTSLKRNQQANDRNN